MERTGIEPVTSGLERRYDALVVCHDQDVNHCEPRRRERREHSLLVEAEQNEVFSGWANEAPLNRALSRRTH